MRFNNYYLFFLSFLVTYSITLHSQSVGILKGVVMDASDKEAIGGANIYDASDKIHGSVSDVNGNYQLSLTSGKHTIVCSFISMRSDTALVFIDSSKTTTHNFTLGSSATELQTMVVSAGKYERKLEDITVSMEVLKSTLIENKNSSNIKSALEQTPGLNILDG